MFIGEYCLPAGSQVLTYSDIICSRHFEPKTQNFHYNAIWCFICTLGKHFKIWLTLFSKVLIKYV